MANSFYEHSGYPPGSRARNSSQKLRAEFSAIEAGAQAIETALDLKADAADVSEVDNTSDADKPISTLTQAALDLKADYSALVDFNPATAGADKMLVTNATGDGWEYPSITAAGKALLDDADAAAQRATLGFPNDALTRSRKNLLINGGFDVWQRGAGPFTTDGYCADGWYFRNLMLSGNSAEQAEFGPIEVATPRSPKYYLTLTAAPGNGCSASARIEYLPQFSGKTLTCSFWTTRLTGSGELDVQLNSNFGTGGTPTMIFRPMTPPGVIFPGTTAFERRTATFTVPDLSSYTLGPPANTSYLELEFSFFNIGAPSSICAIADVQLEFGDTATDFEYRHPAEEFALCQYRYEQYKGALPVVMTQVTPTEVRSTCIKFKSRKPRIPTVTVSALTAVGHSGTPGAFNSVYADQDGFIAVWFWTGGTVGHAFSGIFTWTADAEL